LLAGDKLRTDRALQASSTKTTETYFSTSMLLFSVALDLVRRHWIRAKENVSHRNPPSTLFFLQ
jgi:hypothetical protein